MDVAVAVEVEVAVDVLVAVAVAVLVAVLVLVAVEVGVVKGIIKIWQAWMTLSSWAPGLAGEIGETGVVLNWYNLKAVPITTIANRNVIIPMNKLNLLFFK